MMARWSLDTDPWWARASTGTAPVVCPDEPIISAGGRVCCGTGAWADARPGDCPRPPGNPTSSGDAPAGTRTPSPAAATTRSSWISFSRAVRRSANRREFANTIVDRCSSIRSTTRSSTWGQIDPFDGASEESDPAGGDPSSDMSSTGTTTRRSKVFCAGGAMISTGARPPRNRATSSAGRTVADRPMRCTGLSSRSSSRSSETARCAPRFEDATAWTSSTMTVSTLSRVSRAFDVSIR
jgi:hypothetical protein